MKKILVLGSTGLIGSHIVKALEGKHDVIGASLTASPFKVDISKPASIKNLFEQVGKVDAIICVAGVAKFINWHESTDNDWDFSISNKLMGQINLMRIGEYYLNDAGLIILTTGTMAQHPIVGSGILTTVNAGVEAAVMSFNLETKRHAKAFAMSPGWIKEAMEHLGIDSSRGTPVMNIAERYAKVIEEGFEGHIVYPTNPH